MTGAGLNIAATDLFISATAALLVVLAVLRPTPPVELPIQADLEGYCTLDVEARPVTLVLGVPGHAVDAAPLSVREPAELAQAPTLLDLAPGLFYMIALVPGRDGRLLSDCLTWVRDDLVRAHNASMLQPELSSTAAGTRAIFTLAPTIPTRTEAP